MRLSANRFIIRTPEYCTESLRTDAAYSAYVPIRPISSIKNGGIILNVLLKDVSANREEIHAR